MPIDGLLIPSSLTEMSGCTYPVLSYACIFLLKLALQAFTLITFEIQGLAAAERHHVN